jgi:predicted nucleic acid-binding Zn ribbon protein
MSSPTPGPRCPRCGRTIAAWRLPHCVYCGEPIPPEVKEGFEEPEALKWVERPGVPLDAVKQFEMMKVLPWEQQKKKPRALLVFAAGFSIVLFGAIFVLLFLMLRRGLPSASPVVLAIGVGFVAYLGWVFYRASRRGA